MVVIKEKFLIFNADDFGLDPEINRGIVKSCTEGVVRSVSIVPNGGAFEHAVGLVKDLDQVCVGIHLCLVAERPLRPLSRRRGHAGEAGLLPENYRKLYLALLSGELSYKEVEFELEAQIQKVFDAGIKPTHLDSHQYIHLIPGIFKLVVALAKKYSIRYIRYPYHNEWSSVPTSEGILKRVWMGVFENRQSRTIEQNNLLHPDRSFAMDLCGHLSRNALRAFLPKLVAGKNDVTCHPGFSPSQPCYAVWRYDWEPELEMLTAPDLVRHLSRMNIRLGNYDS